MPYQIKYFKSGEHGVERPHYMIYNLKKKQLVNKHYKTKQAAINAGFNFMKYRKEEPILQGNKILNKKNLNNKK